MYKRQHLLLDLSQKLDIALLLGYYRHVMELPRNFFGKRKVGEIISLFNYAGKVRDAISGAVLTIMIDTLMAVAGAVILYAQNIKLFGIAVKMCIRDRCIAIIHSSIISRSIRCSICDDFNNYRRCFNCGENRRLL